MDVEVAEKLARARMEEWGLVDAGWKFGWGWGMNLFGKVMYMSKTLELSRYLVPLNAEEDVEQITLHEIAHALVGPGHGHDEVWKRQCRIVGCKWPRCYPGHVIVPLGRWVGTCRKCRQEVRQHSKPTGLRGSTANVSCGRCSSRFDPLNLLVWRDEGFDVTRVGRADGRAID